MVYIFVFSPNCINKTLANYQTMCYYNIVVESDNNLTVGVDDVEGPPVPMPNTEVKLDSAENTWMVTSRKDRKMPTFKVAVQ